MAARRVTCITFASPPIISTALVLQQRGEIVEARRHFGMLGAERLLADRQRALEERRAAE